MRVNSPRGIGLAKTTGIQDSKQQQKNCCDSIKQRGLHVLPPKTTAAACRWVSVARWYIRKRLRSVAEDARLWKNWSQSLGMVLLSRGRKGCQSKYHFTRMIQAVSTSGFSGGREGS